MSLRIGDRLKLRAQGWYRNYSYIRAFAYHDPTAEWQLMGQSPVYDTRVPRGFSLLRMELPGFEEVVRIVGTVPVAGGPTSIPKTSRVPTVWNEPTMATGARFRVPT